MKEELFERLKDYSGSDYYPFHMPGHKRNPESGPLKEVYQYDITEIEGFDNLHKPESIIKAAEMRAAKLYCSEDTYFLINGSTVGILSAVSAVADRGEKLIIARNCHKAVYHAAFLNRMELHYVYPEVLREYDITGKVTAEHLEQTIRNSLNYAEKQAKKPQELIAGVVITSPTYDGISSDVKEIADLLHGYGIPLIVDQAHGAHFGLHPAYPENAVKAGADIVIHSVHKTLPAPTQTALLHRNGALIDNDKIRKYLRIYQSSSPSYILMAGIDEAVKKAAEEGYQRLERLLIFRNEFLDKMKKCKHIKVCPLTEPGKILISVKGSSMTGQMLYHILSSQYHLQMEMASGSSVTAVLSMMDKREGFERLFYALEEIDRKIMEKQEQSILSWVDLRPDIRLNLWDAYRQPFTETNINEAEGKTAAEFVNLYPPGIPILVPGEIIDRQIIETINFYLENKYTVEGISGKINMIRVVEV